MPQALITVLSVVVGAAGVVGQERARRRAAKAGRERNAIASATQDVNNRSERRKAAREERIRRAQIINSSANTGALNSSGVQGAIGALSTSLGRNVALQQTNQSGAEGISRQEQNIANARASSDRIGAFTSLIQGGLSEGGDIFDNFSNPLGA